MKTQLQQFIGMAVLGLALCAQSLPAWAGAVSHPTVFIGATGADGSMAGARYSADHIQYIGCSYSATGGPFVTCFARDNTGKSLFCVGNNSGYAAAARAITDFSYIQFDVPPDSATCSLLWVYNYSYYLP
jgi:hypothetical protein